MSGFEPIAIVGRSCLLPGAHSPDELWRLVDDQHDSVTSVPTGRWGIPTEAVMCDGPQDSVDRTWTDRGGFVTGFDELFDPTGFGLEPNQVAPLDEVFKWTMHSAREALRDANYANTDASRFGAVFGNLSFPSAEMARYVQAVTLASPERPDARNRFNSGLPAVLLEQALGLGAGAMALDAACASSLYAIKLAADRLHDGSADLMLAGAVNKADSLCIHLGFAALTALSRSGQSRPFHSEADGLLPAEGSAFIAMKRLADAVADGDEIHGVIRGVGLSNDGRGRGMLVPSKDGQLRAMTNALAMSGLTPEQVSLIECHATGTVVGDGTEIASTSEAYDGANEIPIGSLKSNMGHLITAAGVAGVIKVLEAMRHETRPAGIHTDSPLDSIADTQLRLLTESEKWDRSSTIDGVLRAGVSAFGFGGNNAHLLLEEPNLAVEAGLSAAPSPARGAVAIVGIGIVAAGAANRGQFASALLEQRSCLSSEGLGRIDSVELDLTRQKFPPNDLKAALAQQLAMLAVAEEALEDAGPVPKQSTGVLVGMGTDPKAARFGVRWRLAATAEAEGHTPEWLDRARDAVGPPLDAAGVMGTMPNIAANRLNSQFDLLGPSYTTSSEERSGLDALALGVRALRANEIDAALVGAVDFATDPSHRSALADLSSHAPITGDAAVALVLKRLEDAEASGDYIYAVVPDPGEGERYETDLPLDESSITPLFGHAHAASGLIQVAAAALSLSARVAPGGQPILSSRSGGRSASVEVTPLGGKSSSGLTLVECPGSQAPAVGVPPRVYVFSGSSQDGLLASLAEGSESDAGPHRLVIVARDEAQFADRKERAIKHIVDGHPPGRGVAYRSSPLEGEMAFVYTAAGAAYPGMAGELLVAIPELAGPSQPEFPLRQVAGWIFEDDPGEPSPNDFLWGTSLVSQAHTRLTRGLLGLKPEAAIGYSSGESNSLYAFGVWSDMFEMRSEIDACRMMDAELGIEFRAVARAWGTETADWAVWNALAPLVEVRAALHGEERVHLTIINTGTDCVFAGDPDGCDRVVERLGIGRCRPVNYNLACHTPEVGAAFRQQWISVHTREVTKPEGVRHYSNGTNSAYEVSTEACAAAITAQAESTIDFPATIESAYADGVRIFIEHGPSSACTNFISNILGDRDVLALHLDNKGHNIEQIYHVIAQLLAAGVEVDHQALTERLTPETPAEPDRLARIISFEAHLPPVVLPHSLLPDSTSTSAVSPLPATASNGACVQVMKLAPALPPVLNGSAPAVVTRASAVASEPAPSPTIPGPTVAPSVPPVTTPGPIAGSTEATILAHMAQVSETHKTFVDQQAAMHQRFLAMNTAALTQIPNVQDPGSTEHLGSDTTVTLGSTEHLGSDTTVTQRFAPQPIASAPAVVAPMPEAKPAPLWDFEQLKIHSSGLISELFGPKFAGQDDHTVQCRMPEPPLLLAHRVMSLDAEPAVLGVGTIKTETDVLADAWYLNEGYMPAGFMIESGQADLMLISYMGIDLDNEAERAYRLLGCTLTYHDNLPSPGETLEYEIAITGHAKHGDIRLFFFEYECTVNDRSRLTVCDAQAGFFSRGELNDALGVLWTPEAAAADLDPNARVDAPLVEATANSFSADQVRAFSEGRLLDCFGPGYEWAETHTRSPSIQSGDQLFIDEVTLFDPAGGPWGRGFMRCETKVTPDDWYFKGHFKNDPCMPGNFMVEACIEALSFYLAGLGYTTRRDGWRFQPLPEQPFELKCRGEINPDTRHVAYELHVEEVWDGPHPTVIADVVGIVDGKAAFHAKGIGVELVPDWPLTSRTEIYESRPETKPVAKSPDGFAFDWKAMISCAWGRPSEAFGPMYEMFDGTRRSPRLPGEPYHFISRIINIDGELDVCEAGMEIVCEYDIPPDAWYFDSNGAEVMPFAVLLEAALQPCGWVASAVGSATEGEADMLFRNLDGTGTVLDELTRTSGTLTTHVKLTSVSLAGGMIIEGFEVTCLLGDRPVYEMTTVFGFFPPEAFDNQVGLAISDSDRQLLEIGPGPMTDLVGSPSSHCQGSLKLADPMLRMIDRATLVPGAGEAGLGVLRGEKDVNVSEWFFKAHFFQDPVQPGSLGVEALIQLLQFFMIETKMGEGLENPRFEALSLEAPLTWKYRGQVTPANRLITSTMEVTEVGSDDKGPYVIGKGSLWCDGIRIYEVANMGMRIVSGTEPLTDSPTPTGSVSLDRAKTTMRSFWSRQRRTPDEWLGNDLMDGLVDRYVNSIRTQSPDTLSRIAGRPVIFLANHQVQVESFLISNLLPALTGVTMTTVSHAKHANRWIGQSIDALRSYPGSESADQIAYFDQTRPDTLFDIVDTVKARMADGPHSLFVHADGTRARSCLTPATRCSSIFLELALELGLAIVPIRFTGGLPVTPIEGKAELPVGHGKQDYWIGDPIEASELEALPLKERTKRVLAGINDLGGPNATESPLADDSEFAATVADWQRQTGLGEVFAAMWRILGEVPSPSDETIRLLAAAESGDSLADGSPVGDWLDGLVPLFLGSASSPSVSRVTVAKAALPHLTDHRVNGSVVVPVVYVIEWFARAAAAHSPGLALDRIVDLRVFRGLRVPDFDDGGSLDPEIRVTPIDAEPGRKRLRLNLTSEGRPCYGATVVMAEVTPTTTSLDQPIEAQSTAATEIYSDPVLFHGPAFQVIKSVSEPTESGLTAAICGLFDQGWPTDDEWATDPALNDGALQLALLWCEHRLGGPSLPTSVGEILVRSAPVSGELGAVLIPVSQTKVSTVCDVTVANAAGQIVVEVRGIETHLLPPSD